jgi:hypothetical protein
MTSFAAHGIQHLSASSCNLFAACKALWVQERLLKRSGPVGAAAHRGTAVEAGVTLGLKEPSLPVEDCVREAERVYREKTALSGDPKRDSEGACVPEIVRIVVPHLRGYGPDVLFQHRIEWRHPDISVGFVGFADFYWPDHGILIDLKTQLRLSSEIKTPHARQVALYAGALGDNIDARITYATPKKVATYGLENVREHLKSLVRIGQTIERYLALSSDPQFLASLEAPDIDSFYFNDPATRQITFEVYGV